MPEGSGHAIYLLFSPVDPFPVFPGVLEAVLFPVYPGVLEAVPFPVFPGVLEAVPFPVFPGVLEAVPFPAFPCVLEAVPGQSEARFFSTLETRKRLALVL